MTRKAKCGCLVAVVLAAVVALAPIQTIRGDGGFESAEYRLTFTNSSGRPVPGVTLRVETQAGGVCHLYPINEFLPDSTPTSDADGRMVIHHVSNAMEFGLRHERSLIGVYLVKAEAPQYVCVFRLAGREVGRLTYADLRAVDRDIVSPTVTRNWKDSDWIRREILANRGDWDAVQSRLFDGKQNSELDSEERTARTYFSGLADNVMIDKERSVTFSVVERTITIAP